MKFQNKVEDIWFRLYRIIGRTLIKYSSNPRPSSSPFITGDGFRSIANHVYDNVDTITDPEKIRDGDIVYVGDSRIESFICEVHPHITAQYILITHSGDAPVTDTMLQKVTNKVIHWYGINVLVSDPKVTPIPLGIENKHLFVCGIPSVFKKVIKNKITKKNKVFYAFTITTNPKERQVALNEIEKSPIGETLTKWRGFGPYLTQLNHFKFVLSPPGSSVEGHRTWDTLYIGGVPIVKESITTNYFKKLGLPLLILKDWEEIEDFTEQNLETIFNELKSTENLEALSMDYWVKRIKADTHYA